MSTTTRPTSSAGPRPLSRTAIGSATPTRRSNSASGHRALSSLLPRAASFGTTTMSTAATPYSLRRADATPTNAAMDALVILAPSNDVPKRLPTNVRRPNTAGLREHVQVWRLDKLQNVVTRNGIGGATWTNTMRELRSFGMRRQPGSMAGGDEGDGAMGSDEDDEDIAAAAAQRLEDKRKHAVALVGAAGDSNPVGSRIQAGGRFPLAVVPNDAVLLKMLRGMAALESCMASMPQPSSALPSAVTPRLQVSATSPTKQAQEAAVVLEAVAADLLACITPPEMQKNETRAIGVTVKVVHRHALQDKLAVTFSRDRGDRLLQCFNAFTSAESVAIVPLMVLAIQNVVHPSAERVVHILFHTLKALKVRAHRAELHAAERVVRATAVAADKAEAVARERAAQAAPGSNRRRSFVLPSSPLGRKVIVTHEIECAAEFARLVDQVLQPKRRNEPSAAAGDSGDGGGAFTVVDSVTWAEMRVAIFAGSEDGPYQTLADIVAQYKL